MEHAVPDPARRRRPTFSLLATDDAAFAAQSAAIAGYLYANFPGLRGLQQHRPHFDPARDRTTDPVEHTLEVIARLDTRGLPPPDAAIVRAATVFHDVGKLLDPFNVRHAVESAAICPPYLADFALTPAEQSDAVAVVAHHDVLGRLAQGRIDAAAAAKLFGTPRIAELTFRLSQADVGSIRGLDGALPHIVTAYAAVVAAFAER